MYFYIIMVLSLGTELTSDLISYMDWHTLIPQPLLLFSPGFNIQVFKGHQYLALIF